MVKLITQAQRLEAQPHIHATLDLNYLDKCLELVNHPEYGEALFQVVSVS